MELGAFFKELRCKNKWTQEKMAEEIHVNQSDISKFETNEKLPDLEAFFRIIDATKAHELAALVLFGVDVSTIIQSMAQLVGGLIIWI
ncbi:helix-turn-helix domain-containing protein [Lederbergia lenta]|uniref:helix-turn-helix domain-containing protein n=1 Tax=Lederbergia lenta TaxID=1467 RepID=UPI00203CAD73|nr:helix-turn-helix transcriptional regulator [Lederbergia lenta]MCM3110644.1 helix-turn-helix domain-containing protein [Lederbergia lenta]